MNQRAARQRALLRLLQGETQGALSEAERIALANAPIRMGEVLGRNPDGTYAIQTGRGIQNSNHIGGSALPIGSIAPVIRDNAGGQTVLNAKVFDEEPGRKRRRRGFVPSKPRIICLGCDDPSIFSASVFWVKYDGKKTVIFNKPETFSGFRVISITEFPQISVAPIGEVSGAYPDNHWVAHLSFFCANDEGVTKYLNVEAWGDGYKTVSLDDFSLLSAGSGYSHSRWVETETGTFENPFYDGGIHIDHLAMEAAARNDLGTSSPTFERSVFDTFPESQKYARPVIQSFSKSTDPLTLAVIVQARWIENIPSDNPFAPGRFRRVVTNVNTAVNPNDYINNAVATNITRVYAAEFFSNEFMEDAPENAVFYMYPVGIVLSGLDDDIVAALRGFYGAIPEFSEEQFVLTAFQDNLEEIGSYMTMTIPLVRDTNESTNSSEWEFAIVPVEFYILETFAGSSISESESFGRKDIRRKGQIVDTIEEYEAGFNREATLRVSAFSVDRNFSFDDFRAYVPRELPYYYARQFLYRYLESRSRKIDFISPVEKRELSFISNSKLFVEERDSLTFSTEQGESFSEGDNNINSMTTSVIHFSLDREMSVVDIDGIAHIYDGVELIDTEIFGYVYYSNLVRYGEKVIAKWIVPETEFDGSSIVPTGEFTSYEISVPDKELGQKILDETMSFSSNEFPVSACEATEI